MTRVGEELPRLARAARGRALAVGLLILPMVALGQQRPQPSEELLSRLSQAALLQQWLSAPERAPQPVRERLQQLSKQAAEGRLRPRQATVPGVGLAFNEDLLGLPQNEESITACRSNPSIVLGGTNDYRGLFDPTGNFTGWHFSMDGGASLTSEGRLPAIVFDFYRFPSGGDPVVAADAACNLFAGSLNSGYTPEGGYNAIAVYHSTPSTLASCPGGTAEECWPVRRLVASAAYGHFLDKPWMSIGPSGDGGEVLWVVYTDFDDLRGTSSIAAVRCDTGLVECTPPVLIADALGTFVQLADVTVAPDGRTYFTWADVTVAFDGSQTFVHRMRVAPAGSTTPGPTRLVAIEGMPLAFGAAFNANSFRIATYPKNEVVQAGELSRVFVVWDACGAIPLVNLCEAPVIKLRYSDDDGVSWSPTSIISQGSTNYFPTLSQDGEGTLAVSWYTHRHDELFNSRQDVELVLLDALLVSERERQRLTAVSNEPHADPLLNGFFIGDYFEAFAQPGRVLVHFNANYRRVELLGRGVPVPQQDNYLGVYLPGTGGAAPVQRPGL